MRNDKNRRIDIEMIRGFRANHSGFVRLLVLSFDAIRRH